MSWRLPLSLVLVLGVAATAAAQPVITLNPVKVVGDVVQVAPRAIAVKAGDGRKWTLTIDNTTAVRIKGFAVPEIISPKFCVRFVASIDKRTGKAQEKIDKITVFTPVDGVASRTLGVERAAAGAAEEEDDLTPVPPQLGPPGPPGGRGPAMGPGQMPPRGARGQRPPPGQGAGFDALRAPGANTNVEDPAASGKPPKRRNNAGKAAGDAVPDVDSYEVCAQVVSFHGRHLLVNVPNRFVKARIMADLSPDAEIAVDLSDLSLVKAGDKVAAGGWYVTPGVCAQTSKLIVTLAKPLAPPGSHAHHPRPAAKSGETAHHAGGKMKPAPADAAEPPDGEEPAPAARPPARAPAVEQPKENEENPVMDDPAAKPGQIKPEAPKPEVKKPETKKPDKTPPKKTPEDDEKDVFEK